MHRPIFSVTLMLIALVLLTPACYVPNDGRSGGNAGGSAACRPDVTEPQGWTASTGADDAFAHNNGTASEMRFSASAPSRAAFVVRFFSGTPDFPTSPLAAPSGPIDLGHDAELSSCGACVYFWDCFGCGPADSPRYYFAASGTLTVLELGGKDDKLRATLTDVVLRHVTADGTAAVTDAPDLCKFTVAEAGINTGFFYASGDFVPRRLPLPDER